MTPSPPYSQLDELDAHLPDDVIEQVAKLAYLLHAELVEWQAPRSLVAQAVAKAATCVESTSASGAPKILH